MGTKGDKAAGWYPPDPGLKPPGAGPFRLLRDGVAVGAVAGVLSGAPSTVHALVTGADPLAAIRAAGNLLLPADARPAALLAAGAVAHVARRRWPLIRALPVGPQVADHLAFGAIAGAVLAARG